MKNKRLAIEKTLDGEKNYGKDRVLIISILFSLLLFIFRSSNSFWIMVKPTLADESYSFSLPLHFSFENDR